MSPNKKNQINNQISSQSDSSIDSVSSPRRSRSLSIASQSSSERGSHKMHHGSSGGSNSSHHKSQRKSSSLPVETVEYLKAWMMSPEHIAHPYPTDQEKAQIMADTGIELKQLTNWFVNNRKRYWKPRVEARLQQQAQVAVAVANAAVASVIPMVMSTAPTSPTTPTPYMSSPPTSTTFMVLDHHRISQSPPPSSTPVTKPVVSATSTPVDREMKANQGVSVVTAENLAAFLPVVPSSPHTVSELSSSASDVGSVDFSCTESEEGTSPAVILSDCSDESDATTTTHIETVDVHILRPLRGRNEPTIEDVTILPNVPADRILRTYPNCALTYHLASDTACNRKKMQSRRDAEIVRIKKHYLRCYLAERESMVDSFLGKRMRPIVEDDDEEEEETPRLKYRCAPASPDYWRLVCQTAINPHDEALPSLEEAARMFGYAATN